MSATGGIRTRTPSRAPGSQPGTSTVPSRSQERGINESNAGLRVWKPLGRHDLCPEVGCRTGLEPAYTRFTTWGLDHFGFRHKPLRGIEPPRPTFAGSAPGPLAAAIAVRGKGHFVPRFQAGFTLQPPSGLYGTRTRDLLRDRKASTPSALTSRKPQSRIELDLSASKANVRFHRQGQECRRWDSNPHAH